ncbi:Tim44-like domain-containing protein [Chitinivorax sp. B]|uniref:Tim44 domain-containing protein n=1 Tax=Chitinivorax sp. B TaxID=2502235 RepID=UPI0010F5E707|nr:Tim44-like domain-containing protein [Chitinivorax sp. B]
MKPKMNLLVMSLATAAVLAAPFAEAGRLGGGKSKGMSRSTTARPAPSTVVPQPQALPQRPIGQPLPAAQAAKSGPGWGGVAAGAVAGAAAGYVISEAMKDDQPANAAQQAAAPSALPGPNAATTQPVQLPAQTKLPGESTAAPTGFPWGMALLLGGLTVVGFMLFRRKAGSPAMAGAARQPFTPATAGGTGGDKVFRIGGGVAPAASQAAVSGRLSDGTEVPAFLRQARASFMHLQTLNSPESVEELRKYLTPDLYESIKLDVVTNKDVAEFPTLDAEVIESTTENGQHIATVRFHGRVSESLHSMPEPFEELWHFIKPVEGNTAKWLVAGIQQV